MCFMNECACVRVHTHTCTMCIHACICTHISTFLPGDGAIQSCFCLLVPLAVILKENSVQPDKRGCPVVLWA